jgi:hypothetical protein
MQKAEGTNCSDKTTQKRCSRTAKIMTYALIASMQNQHQGMQ